jgi:hypothetical protein
MNKRKKKINFELEKKKSAEIASVKDAEIRIRGIIKDFAKLHTQEQR